MRPIFFLFLIFYAVGAVQASQIFGVGTHAGQERISFLNAHSLLNEGGFDSFRDEIYWGRVERDFGSLGLNTGLSGIVNLTAWGSLNSRGLIILDYGNLYYDRGGLPLSNAAVKGFVNYSAFVSRNFSGKVFGYEIWNEWNIGAGGVKGAQRYGDPQAYVKLVSAVAPIIRLNDPSAKLLCGAVADMDTRWISSALEYGLMDICDGLSVHPYNFSNRPFKNDPEASFEWVDSIYSLLLKSSSKSKKIFLTEIGWPTHTGKGSVSEEILGAYLAQTVVLMRARPFVGGTWWYELLDGGHSKLDKEEHFGLVRSDFSKKPGFYYYKNISQLLSGSRPGVFRKIDKLRRMQEFIFDDNSRISVVWSRGAQAADFSFEVTEPVSVFYLSSGGAKQMTSATFDESVGPLPVFIRHNGALNVR